MSASNVISVYEERRAARRRAGVLDALGEALDEAIAIPPPVREIVPPKHGRPPTLSAEAYELARQVYYLQQGTLRDAARAVIAAGLSDTDDLTTAYERLQTWWQQRGWPKRSKSSTFAIRDASHDGGLFRSARVCAGVATGSGPAPKGKKCQHSALPDSDFCFHHDPRPQYAAQRQDQAERLRAGRQADLVPLEPFQRWAGHRRRELLEEAKASGRRLHPNNTGWSLLAEVLDLDVTMLSRWMLGKHSSPQRPPVTTIGAATVAGYLERAGTTFQAVYGFDPPPPKGGAGMTCPNCGDPKAHASKTCLACYERSHGERCTYVTRSGRACNVRTTHPSGTCGTHRRITERVPKPRPGRPTHFTTAMLMFALDEYVDVPVPAWVARRMWLHDAGGVRAAFKSYSTVASGLIKQFDKRGWRDVDVARRALAELIAKHGPIQWPEPGR